MRTLLALAFTITLGVLAAAEEPRAEDARKKAIHQALETFTGTWEVVRTDPEGNMKEARTLVFRRDLTYAALDQNGKELWAGTFEIDPTASPKVWDHRTDESRKEGTDVLGIYDLGGDKLRVACVVGHWKGTQWMGKPRPARFDRKEADVVLELRRTAARP